MKSIHIRLGIAAVAVATSVATLAAVAHAGRMIENKVLVGGGCYSPQEGYNACDLTSHFPVIRKRQICSPADDCGSAPNGHKVSEIWQIEVAE